MDLKPTHFKCDSCGKINTIKNRKIRLCDYTCWDRDSHLKFYSNRYHIQLCERCDRRINNENDSRNKK